MFSAADTFLFSYGLLMRMRFVAVTVVACKDASLFLL
jgi:hypothetical protein